MTETTKMTKRIMIDREVVGPGGARYDISMDGKPLGRVRVPRLDGARLLLRMGWPPETLLTTRWRGNDFDNWQPATVGHLAGMSVTETESQGIKRIRFQADTRFTAAATAAAAA